MLPTTRDAMNIINDQSTTDYVDYFTKQLPKDLAAMAALRDELAKRQGAMSAVEDANKFKAEAEKVLADAKVQAEDVKKKQAAVKQKEAEVDSRAEKVKADADARSKELDAREAELAKRVSEVKRQEEWYAEKFAALEKEQAKLAVDRSALDARVKEFQNKVAALKV